MRRALPALVVLGAVSSCEDQAAARAREQLAELQRKKAEQARAKDADQHAVAAVEQVTLPPPYDESSATAVLHPDGPCPPGLWALFPGPAPGATPEERAANEARRPDLVATLTAGTYLVKLRAPVTVLLAPYDAAQGRFVIETVGTIDCRDAHGRVAVAWTPAKVADPGAEAGGLRENLWRAPGLKFALPMKSLTEAREFNDRNRLQLSARVALTFLRGRVDHKPVKGPAGVEDWGAGRLAEAAIVGIRLATRREAQQLLDQRPGR